MTTTAITVVVILVVVQGLILVGLKTWLTTEITESIKRDFSRGLEEYKLTLSRELEAHKNALAGKLEDYKAQHARQLEGYKTELRRQEQSAEVAKLLAVIAGGPKDVVEAHELIWRVSLWLPGPLVHQLSESLVNPAKVDPKEVLVAVRKLLHGPDDIVTADQITHIQRFGMPPPSLIMKITPQALTVFAANGNLGVFTSSAGNGEIGIHLPASLTAKEFEERARTILPAGMWSVRPAKLLVTNK